MSKTRKLQACHKRWEKGGKTARESKQATRDFREQTYKGQRFSARGAPVAKIEVLQVGEKVFQLIFDGVSGRKGK